MSELTDAADAYEAAVADWILASAVAGLLRAVDAEHRRYPNEFGSFCSCSPRDYDWPCTAPLYLAAHAVAAAVLGVSPQEEGTQQP